MNRQRLMLGIAMLAVAGCAATPEKGTLADLRQVQPEVDEVELENSLEMAAESYRRFLEQTPQGRMTPEAMRRLADLQIEQEYGIITGDVASTLPTPESAFTPGDNTAEVQVAGIADIDESQRDFEQRASEQHDILSDVSAADVQLPEGVDDLARAGPLEAIQTYRKILEMYPGYERNDQVLYQMSRAYDELGKNDDAIQVMERMIREYPYSKYSAEVQFRRGEYYFIRKQYLDAEDAYSAIIDMGSDSSYYELALYKMGWTLYKQELYEEALHRYIAMLDYRLSVGDDFDQEYEEEGNRVADTFRVVSLSFSNLGGARVIDNYFSARGNRSYSDKIYSNLGEFYLSKLRYNDAASVYESFVELNRFHRVAPHFNMRAVEIYEQGGFPLLVVESKKEFATRYGLQARYWQHFDSAESPDVLSYLKTNLTDLANHYHSLYQNVAFATEQAASYAQALRWYREFLASFPDDPESPSVNYQLADLLLEYRDYGEAAREYERTAYDYPQHELASAAGYAAIYAHRENLNAATGAHQVEVKRETVTSSLRFADTFPNHEQAAVVLGSAADDLYAMQDYLPAIATAQKLIERHTNADSSLLRSAWVVVAHSSIDIAEYPQAELAYTQVLDLTEPDDESLAAIVDGLAASIYKQGEQAKLLEDYRAAAEHFLRIKDVAPGSAIRTSAEYDAAAALIHLKDWSMAADTLENFRRDNAEHELHAEATRQLASVYREDGQIARSAAEYERVASESDDPELSREALLLAGELYEQASSMDSALSVYLHYVVEFPRPLDLALETRSKVADIYKARHEQSLYQQELQQIVALDKSAGGERTDRSRYLAGQAALVLAEELYQQFAELQLTLPFEESLAEKQSRMDTALGAFEGLVEYEVAEVTAAATYHIAEIYFDFSNALLESERPTELNATQMVDYEMVIEEEAFPFEERAIDVHEENFGLLARGIYNPWVQKSLEKLAVLMPGRYAKYEHSSGFVGSIDIYAYRMPNAPDTDMDGQEDSNVSDSGESETAASTTAQVVGIDSAPQVESY